MEGHGSMESTNKVAASYAPPGGLSQGSKGVCASSSKSYHEFSICNGFENLGLASLVRTISLHNS